MKTGVILDTDIGYDPDDLFALLLLLNSPELKLDLIVTGDEVDGKRAAFTKKVLDQYGRNDLKVVQGDDLGNHGFLIDELLEGASFSIDKNYLRAMHKVLESKDKAIYINIQGFTNLANLLKKYPKSKEKLSVFQMGGAIDFSLRPGWVEHNVRIDPKAARYVLTSGIDISLIMAQTTFNPVYRLNNQHQIFKKLKKSNNPVHKMLARHCELYYKTTKHWPYMHDPLTASVAMGKKFVDFYNYGISVDEKGNMNPSSQSPKLHLSKPKSRDKEFMQFLKDRMFV